MNTPGFEFAKRYPHKPEDTKLTWYSVLDTRHVRTCQLRGEGGLGGCYPSLIISEQRIKFLDRKMCKTNKKQHRPVVKD